MNREPTNQTLKLVDVKTAMSKQSQILELQAALRSAMYDGITESDMKQIVTSQVEKAKSGDSDAIRFVMSLVGHGQNVKLVQNNIHTDAATAARMMRNGGNDGRP